MNEIIWTYTNTNGVLIYYGDDYIYDALGITKYIAIPVFLSSVPQGNIQSVEGACKYHTFNVREKKHPLYTKGEHYKLITIHMNISITNK